MHAIKAILRLALPLTVQNICEFSLAIVSLLFISRLGQQALASAVLAISLFNISGLSIVVGLSGALETLCGQAYGAGNYHLMGEVLQRATLTCFAVAGVIILIWTQSEHILVLLGQPHDSAALAATFLLAISPSLLSYVVVETVKRFLFSQGIAIPAAAASGVSAVMSPVLFLVITKVLGPGLLSAAIAFFVCASLAPLLLVLYTALHLARIPREDAKHALWSGFSCEALRGWVPYFRLGVPSAAMVCLEWWVFEVLAVMAGWLPDPTASLAVVGVCIQLQNLAYTVPLGIASATSACLANCLGAGNPTAAKSVVRYALMLTLAAASACICVIVPCRFLIARVFLPPKLAESRVIHMLADCLAIVAAGLPGDWLNCCMMGVLRGSGRQKIGAVSNFVGYWIVGVALVRTLAFTLGWGARGLWAGLTIVSTLQACLLLVVLGTMDWRQEAARAMALIAPSAHGLPPLWEQPFETESAYAYSEVSEVDVLVLHHDTPTAMVHHDGYDAQTSRAEVKCHGIGRDHNVYLGTFFEPLLPHSPSRFVA